MQSDIILGILWIDQRRQLSVKFIVLDLLLLLTVAVICF